MEIKRAQVIRFVNFFVDIFVWNWERRVLSFDEGCLKDDNRLFHLAKTLDMD